MNIDLPLLQFLIALLIGLGSLGIFIWAVLSGMFRDVEQVKMRAYRAEVPEHDDEEDGNEDERHGIRRRH